MLDMKDILTIGFIFFFGGIFVGYLIFHDSYMVNIEDAETQQVVAQESQTHTHEIVEEPTSTFTIDVNNDDYSGMVDGFLKREYDYDYEVRAHGQERDWETNITEFTPLSNKEKTCIIAQGHGLGQFAMQCIDKQEQL